MPTVTVNVNGELTGDTGDFSENATTILSRASDGDTGTTFNNTTGTGDPSLTFELQDVSDVEALSGASRLNTIKGVVFAAAGGKGSINFSIELINSSGVLNSTTDLGGSSGTQTEFNGENLDISSYTSEQFNDIQLRYTCTGGTQPIVSQVFAVVDYVGSGNGIIKLTSGLLKLTQGKISL